MRKILFSTLLLFLLSSLVCAQQADTLVVVGDIELIGNKTTIDRILLREITYKKGDTLKIQEFKKRSKESQDNLMNTSLFNFATIVIL